MSADSLDAQTGPGANDNEPLPKVTAHDGESLSRVVEGNDDSKSAEENKFQQAIASWRSK